MTIGEKIKKQIAANGTSLGWVAKQIGMSRPGFNTMLETDSIKVSTLMKVADVLNVPVLYFLLDETGKEENAVIDLNNHYIQSMTFVASNYHLAIEEIKKLLSVAGNDDNKSKNQLVSEIEIVVRMLENSMNTHKSSLIKLVSAELGKKSDEEIERYLQFQQEHIIKPMTEILQKKEPKNK